MAARFRNVLVIAALALAVAAVPAARTSAGSDPTADALAAAVAAGRLDQSLASQAVNAGQADGFVVLRTDVRPASVSPAPYDDVKRRALAPAGADARVIQDYDRVSTQFVHFADAKALVKVLAAPEVAAVRANKRHTADLAESLPLIRQPQAASAGFTGAGYSVVIIDTGLEYTRAAFGSCPNPLPNPAPAGCKVAYVADMAPNDSALDANGHGTNVAAIALGVAPGARAIGLDVFDGAFAYDNYIVDAINWAIANKSAYNIVSANLSLGDGSYNTSTCAATTYQNAFADLRANGIIPVVAAGNGAYSGNPPAFTNGISAPACAPGAVSVGAVYDSALGSVGYSSCADSTATDKITCFSQTAPILSLLAPGAAITAAGVTMYGTSQAAPHVAGAVAVLAQAAPGSTVGQREAALTGSGPQITDTRGGVNITKRRLDVCAAVSALGPACGAGSAYRLAFTTQPASGSSGVPLPTQPVVTVQDSSGATVATDTSTVTLNLVGAGGSLSCSGGLSKAAVGGVAAFTGCTVTGAGTFTLHATDGALVAADSSSFSTSLAATKLAFTAAPASAAPGVAFATQPVVALQDANGASVPGAAANVTLSLSSGPGTLSCTGGTTVAATGGFALFSGCSVNAAGSFTLHAAATGLTAADSAAFTAAAGGLPSAPAFTAPTVSSTGVQVNWTDNATNEQGYRVLKYTPGGWTQQGADLPAGTTTWSDSGLAPGAYYAYWVQAFNASGSAATPSFLTVITTGRPAAPTPASAAGASATSVRVTWTDNSDNETGFKVLRYGSGTWSEVGSVGANANSFTDTGLTSGQTYAYWVVSYNSAGLTYAPAYIAATAFPSPAGATAPLYNGATVTTTTATLNWLDNSSGANQEDGYRVLRLGPGGWVQVGGDLPANTTSLTDTGLTAGSYYGYWVLSLKGGALTYAPSYLTAITASLLPAAPSFTSATAASASTATLTWSDNSANETGFKVLRYVAGVWTEVGSVGANVTTFTDSGLAGATPYAYWITAYSGAGVTYGGALISVSTP